MQKYNERAILLMGPTATGKTELVLKLADYYPIEIISVDSALIYKNMDIGTAKPTYEELVKVPHHLIDIISPLESYSVAKFIKEAINLIKQINNRGHLPVLVGGTMMYFNAFINGISKLPDSNNDIRQLLEKMADMHGWEFLYNKLLAIDSETKIEPADKQRIIRNLEVYHLTGKPLSQLQLENKEFLTKHINFLPLAIIPHDREILHKRISTRFDNMIERGFITEVQGLKLKYPQLTATHASMRCVGYAQIWKYLLNEFSIEELANITKAATRQLAKRQITWLKSLEVINIDNGNLEIDKIFDKLLEYLNNFNINN